MAEGVVSLIRASAHSALGFFTITIDLSGKDDVDRFLETFRKRTHTVIGHTW